MIARPICLFLAFAAGLVPGAAVAAPPVVVARHLDNPRGLAFGPGGSLYMALSGNGGTTGAIDRLRADGTVATVLGGLPSLGDEEALGPQDIGFGRSGQIYTAISPRLDQRPLPASTTRLLGRLIRVDRGRPEARVSLAGVEFRHDADGGGKESDPFGIARIGDTLYVTDSGANDLLRVRRGKASVVTVFPKPGPHSESVPTGIRVGPDGALYVGEFVGRPTHTGMARVWRIVPGHRPTVFARGLDNIIGLGFGPDRSLYVAEFTRDVSQFSDNGDVVRIAPNGARTRLGVHQLPFPGGVAVAHDGTVYVTTNTVDPGSGQLVALTP